MSNNEGVFTTTITTAYDAEGHVVSQRGVTYPVDYAYDEFGDKVSMTTYRTRGTGNGELGTGVQGDVTRWLRDEATGLVTNKVYADDSIVTYTYTTDGLLLRETKPSGVWMENVYDAARQTVGVISSDGAQDAIMQRDRFGHVTAESNSVAQTEYSLDDFWGATNEVQTVDAISVTFKREFDAYGRLVRFARIGGEGTLFGYAPHGSACAVSNGSVAVEYAFTEDVLDAGHILAIQGCADFSREVSRHEHLRNLIVSVSNRCGNISHGLGYRYDTLQRPISRNEDTFGYNVRGEIVSATIDGQNESHSYDDIGNAVQASYPASTNDYTSNCRNQYSSIAAIAGETQLVSSVFFDLDGNMTRHGEWTYVYDSGNRLVSVATNGTTIATMSYDTYGRRVKKVAADGTHRYFYDGKLLVYEHITRPDNTISEIEYVWGNDISGTRDGAAGIGGLLCQKRDGAIYVPWYDAYGNILSYRDAQGNLVASYAYDVFGNIISQSGAMADVLAFRYSTKYFDSEIGLYYYGYRFYSPELMRWITRDPIGEEGGENLYAFCENSPVDAFDEFGLWTATSESAGKSRRVYKVEDGDTLESLAKIVGLDSKEWQNWALSEKSTVADKTTASKIANNSKPGCYVSVPNVWISADLLRGGNWYWDTIVNQGGTIGRFFGTTLLTSSNYMIVKPDNAKELISALNDNKGDVWGLTVFAHGNKFGQIIMPTESHVYGETWTDTDTVVALVKQNGYKIAKAYMMQCYSAYKGVTPKPDVRQVDFGAMWRSVSVRFFGYVGVNVLLLDVVPSRSPRRRGGRRR